MWRCVLTRTAQLHRHVPGYKGKHLKLHLFWTAVLKKARAVYFGGIFWQFQKPCFVSGVSPVVFEASQRYCSYKPSSILQKVSVCCRDTNSTDSHHMIFVTTVKPVVPKCRVPKSVPFGKSAELSCVEEEGFPKSQYQWFKNKEEIPDDPKTSLKFFNSSYTLNADTGALVSWNAHVFGQGHTSGQGGAVGTVAWCPGVGADILGTWLGVSSLSHKRNLLPWFAHSSIFAYFPARLRAFLSARCDSRAVNCWKYRFFSKTKSPVSVDHHLGWGPEGINFTL